MAEKNKNINYIHTWTAHYREMCLCLHRAFVYTAQNVPTIHSPVSCLPLPPLTYTLTNKIICISLGDIPAGLWVCYKCTKKFPYCTFNHSTDKAGMFSEVGKRRHTKKLMRFFLSYTSRGRGPLSSTVIRLELNWGCCFAALSLFML